MFRIEEMFIKMNRPYTAITPTGMVLHETANPGAGALMHYNYFNTTKVSASAHAFIDNTRIIQTIPWKEKAWHAGTYANQNFIGIEMCNYPDAARFGIVYNNTVELFAHIFINVLNITTVNKLNLWSHKEISDIFKQTDHQDPISYLQKFGKTMDGFRSDVQAMINTQLMIKSLNKMVAAKLINSPQYWIDNCRPTGIVNGEWLGIMMKNVVKVGTVAEAAQTLFNKQLINSPQYWVENAVPGKTVQGEYAKAMIIKLGQLI